MPFELELLKQRITELEAENVVIAELRKENAELRKENTDFRMKFANFEAERAELRARIEELESEKIEVRDRLTKVEQRQSQNDNTPNNNSPNFNLGVDHHEKSSQEKEMDNFLDGANKKRISDDIRQRNKEKKLQRESAVQNVVPNPACTTDTVTIVNELKSQTVDKNNNCTSPESSCEIEVVANTSQDHAQKCIANSIVDSKVPHDIKTVNLVNDQDKSAVEASIATEFVQG